MVRTNMSCRMISLRWQTREDGRGDEATWGFGNTGQSMPSIRCGLSWVWMLADCAARWSGLDCEGRIIWISYS